MDFEKQQVGTASREDFASNEEQVAAKKQAIAEAAAAGDYDKVAELAQAAKGLEADKNEMMGTVQEEATAENAERDMVVKKESDHAEALEMNKAFDESKAVEAAAQERARIAEEDRLSAEADAAVAAKLAEQIKNGNVGAEAQLVSSGVENQEANKESRYRGTVKYSKDGSIPSMFMASRFDPAIMLEAYRKNPRGNVSRIPVALLEDQEFVAGLKKIYQERNPEGDFDKFLGNKEKFSSDTMTEDMIPTDESLRTARAEAVIYNLGQGSQTLDEMGVSPKEVSGMFKQAILGELDDRVPNFGTNLSKFGASEDVQRVAEIGGADVAAVLDDPEVRKKIQDAIPVIIRRSHGSDPWGEKYLKIFQETLKVTPDEMKTGWEQARSKYGSEIRNPHW